MEQVQQPKACETYYSACGKIDGHNRHRQATLMLENKLPTKEWSRRVNMSIFGMLVVDAWLAFSACTEADETQKEFYSLLSEELIDTSLISPHVPTLQEKTLEEKSFTSEYIISFCTGALMRQTVDGAWITTEQPVSDDLKYHSVLSPCASLTPFPSHINATRLGLSNVYMQHAICEPYCTYMAGMKFTPLYNEDTILLPDFLLTTNHVISGSQRSFPGLNLFAVFMNMHLTHEDGVVMSRSASERFKYKAEINRTLSVFDRHIPDVGTIIEPYSRNWWQCHFKGTVIVVKQIDPDRILLILSCICYPVNGDKFTTLHGQKGVVTILEDHKMPHISDRQAEIVIGSSSILKRGTVSQMLEAAYSQHAIDNMNLNSHITYSDAVKDYMDNYNYHGSDITRAFKTYEKDIIINDSTVTRKVYKVYSEISEARSVRAS